MSPPISPRTSICRLLSEFVNIKLVKGSLTRVNSTALVGDIRSDDTIRMVVAGFVQGYHWSIGIDIWLRIVSHRLYSCACLSSCVCEHFLDWALHRIIKLIATDKGWLLVKSEAVCLDASMVQDLEYKAWTSVTTSLLLLRTVD